ncbi:alpha/beta fold hydrolase [Marinobacter caseinilyticus]|uniref:alpha/beta fold hydrolase n=1 Tax=Marinobacter caseinilyticus TaxID=2692195 RepID=UPI00140C4A54|nr:alpha/beta hydrolase [Marinobacter caseinilyticus]
MNNAVVSEAERTSVLDGQEMRWPLRHLTLAGVNWPAKEDVPTSQPPAVLLHGWLDNCLSFARLAPRLQQSANVYAVDMAGHGLSEHRPPGQGYLLADYVSDLAELIDSAFETPVDLVGHSLGGIVTMMYAAAFPEKVRKLVVIDSFGPIAKPPKDAVSQLRRGILKRLSGSSQGARYPTVENAASIRAGGLSPLSDTAAMTLVPRNLRQNPSGFEWRTDPRLRHPSLMMFSEEQVLAFLDAVTTDTLLIRATQGLLSDLKRWQPRLDRVDSLKTVSIDGSHHCHLEGDIAPVADAIREFLTDDK